MKEIYEYTDFRDYLSEYFADRKKANPHFSHQLFAQKAGIKSTGFVLHVMKGQRNCTKPVLLKISRAIGLNPAQTDYFEDLVSFDQAKNQSDKEHYFNRIALKRKNAKVKTLDDRQYEFYSQWYHSVIRELVPLIGNAANVKTLSKVLIPAVTPTQFKKSLKLQEELGLIRKKEDGSFEQAESFITAGGTVRNVALVNYQKAMLNEALQAWDRFKSAELMMSTVTVSMSMETAETIKKEIRDFKNRLFEIVSKEKSKPERVFHLNLNLFPLTKVIGKELL
ncbi:MAG TPA: TIGR02147 family protein [Chitinivibrionales bacterium]